MSSELLWDLAALGGRGVRQQPPLRPQPTWKSPTPRRRGPHPDRAGGNCRGTGCGLALSPLPPFEPHGTDLLGAHPTGALGFCPAQHRVAVGGVHFQDLLDLRRGCEGGRGLGQRLACGARSGVPPPWRAAPPLRGRRRSSSCFGRSLWGGVRLVGRPGHRRGVVSPNRIGSPTARYRLIPWNLLLGNHLN